MEHVLYCDNIATLQDLHRQLAQVLGFPDYYGANLSALYDCMTDLPPLTLRLVNQEMLVKNLGEKGARFLQVLQDSAQENTHITIVLQ